MYRLCERNTNFSLYHGASPLQQVGRIKSKWFTLCSWPGYRTSQDSHRLPLSLWLEFCEHVQWSVNTESNQDSGHYWKKLPSLEAYKPRYFYTLVIHLESNDDNEWLTAYFRMHLHCKRWLQGAWLISSRAGQCQQWTWGQTKAHLLILLDSDSGTPGCGLLFILHWTETWLSFTIPYQQISTYYNCCGRKKKWRKTSHSSSCWVDRTNSPHLRPRVQPSVPSWLPRHAGWWPSTACRGTHGRCKGQSSHPVRVLKHPSIYGYTVNIRFIQVH